MENKGDITRKMRRAEVYGREEILMKTQYFVKPLFISF